MRLSISLALFIVLSLASIPSARSASAPDEPIRIGAIFALSGTAKNSNEAAVLGVKTAIAEINAGGGLLDRPVELLLYDNESTPIGSHLAAKKAIEAGAVGIIGAIWSSHSLAIAKVAQQNEIPMISPNSTIPSLTKIGDYIFRICFNDAFQGKVLARFAARELHAKTAILFVDLASDFSLALSRTFSKTFTSLGGTVLGEIEYKTSQDTYDLQLARGQQYQADLAFFSGHDESGYLAAALQNLGSNSIPLGSDAWDVESFYMGGGNRLNRGYYASHWFPDPHNSRIKKLIEKYAELETVTTPIALAYDATTLLAEAITAGQSTSPDRMRDTLQSTRNFPGLTGPISFDEHGDALKKTCIIEIKNGIPRQLRWYDK